MRRTLMHFTVSAETLPLPMYLTYPKGFTVTDSPGFTPDSMFRRLRRQEAFIV